MAVAYEPNRATTHRKINIMSQLTKSSARIQLGFQLEANDAATVREAAKARGENLAQYMRRVVLEWSHAELGLKAPDMSSYSGDVIASAAKSVGLSVQQFTARAAKEAAMRALHGEDWAQEQERILQRAKSRLGNTSSDETSKELNATLDRAGRISDVPPAHGVSGSRRRTG